jgi:hypothetical protein
MTPNIGGWFLLFLNVQIAVFELWATVTNHQTMSMWVWKIDVLYLWFRPLVVVTMLVLMWHFHFFRSPKL